MTKNKIVRLLLTRIFILFTISFYGIAFNAQTFFKHADSLRQKFKIPELAYAVVSSDSVLELCVSGTHKINGKGKAQLNDRFRIGSNTKTVTAYIAALLVKQKKIAWDTRFFDVFPELKSQSHPAYHACTLQDLITFRVNILSWTYTYEKPSIHDIKGDKHQQQYAFIAWILRQEPDTARKVPYWSNPSYVAAGMMLEKASGKTYEELVAELGQTLRVSFSFGQPNTIDPRQPWGHNQDLIPEKPALNKKLNWLGPAGNITVSLPDYCKFIQLQLQGLRGQSEIFTAEEFNTFHYGLPGFSYGWQMVKDDTSGLRYSYHKGNPGTFLSKVFICRETNRAFIFFTNVQSNEAEEGISVLFNRLREKYNP